MLLRVSPRDGRLSTRARVSEGSLRGAGHVARHAAVPDGTGAGASPGVGVGAVIGADARVDGYISGSAPLSETFAGEAFPYEEYPGGTRDVMDFPKKLFNLGATVLALTIGAFGWNVDVEVENRRVIPRIPQFIVARSTVVVQFH